MSHPRYRLVLEALPDDVPAEVRLRSLLKIAGRRLRLKCRSVGPVEEVAEAAAPTPAAPATAAEPGEAAPGPAWTGWVRVAQGEPWLAIASGAGRDQVEQRLRRFAPTDSEQVVLAAGERPDSGPWR